MARRLRDMQNGGIKIMKIAIRENELYKECDWNEYFKHDITNNIGEVIENKKDLTLPPYNYQILEIDDVEIDGIRVADFDNIEGKFVFNREKYILRIEYEKASRIAQEYSDKVRQLIADRYSYADELAIIRQKDTKPEEYQEYFEYCENCKAIAKLQL